MAVAILTQQELKKHINYNPETGVFTRVNSTRWDFAGGDTGTGYKRISIKGKTYKAHRLAWLYVTGNMPDGVIDHINGIRDDNRFCNLREVTTKQNAQNMKSARRDNKSGYLGVNVEGSKFSASIKVDGKKKYLGSYPTPEQAHEAYIQAKRQLHECCTI